MCVSVGELEKLFVEKVVIHSVKSGTKINKDRYSFLFIFKARFNVLYQVQ